MKKRVLYYINHDEEEFMTLLKWHFYPCTVLQYRNKIYFNQFRHETDFGLSLTKFIRAEQLNSIISHSCAEFHQQ